MVLERGVRFPIIPIAKDVSEAKRQLDFSFKSPLLPTELKIMDRSALGYHSGIMESSPFNRQQHERDFQNDQRNQMLVHMPLEVFHKLAQDPEFRSLFFRATSSDENKETNSQGLIDLDTIDAQINAGRKKGLSPFVQVYWRFKVDEEEDRESGSRLHPNHVLCVDVHPGSVPEGMSDEEFVAIVHTMASVSESQVISVGEPQEAKIPQPVAA